MPQKSVARKRQRNWDLESFSSLRLQLEGSGLIMSGEPKSTLQGQEALAAFKTLAQLPDYVSLLSQGEIRPDTCLEGFFVLYEYLFKIGFKWPFPHFLGPLWLILKLLQDNSCLNFGGYYNV